MTAKTEEEILIDALQRHRSWLVGGGGIALPNSKAEAIITALQRSVVVEEGLEAEVRHLIELLAEARERAERLEAAVQEALDHLALNFPGRAREILEAAL